MNWHPVSSPIQPHEHIPAERKVVLVWLKESALPFCGYIRYAAGDKDSPFFVVYHGNSLIGSDVVAWCDCMPDQGPYLRIAAMYKKEQKTGRGLPERKGYCEKPAEMERTAGVCRMMSLEEMPSPRFEFRWIKTGNTWHERECIYSLVLPLRKLDIRSTDAEGNPKELTLEISRTKCSSGRGESPIWDGKVDTPYRDGAHAQWDCDAIGGHIPIIAICGDVWTRIDKRPRASDE